jgi:tetratricopeptide (TPR) repeat protein
MKNARELERAIALRDSRNLKEAYAVYMSVAEETDNSLERAEILLTTVSILVELGDAEGARSQLKIVNKLVAADGSFGDVEEQTIQMRVSLASELLEIMVSSLEGKTREAVTLYDRFLRNHKEEFEKPEFEDLGQAAKGERAILLADGGFFKQALPTFEELVSEDQDNAILNFYLGYCYISVAEYGKAKQLLEKSIKQGLPPHFEFRAHSALGMALYQSGHFSHAKLELERGLKSANPRFVKEAQLWKWLHLTCKNLGLKQEAEYYSKLMRPAS